MSNIKYFYVRQPDQNTEKFGHRGRPVACVAYKVSRCRDYMENNDAVNRIQYALATVSDRPDEYGWIDNFDKREGRALALERLLYTNGVECEHLYTDSEKSADITADIMFALYSDGLTPSRVKKAAKKWLWPSTSFNRQVDKSSGITSLDKDEYEIVLHRDVEGYMTLWQSFKAWVKSVFS
jgi:hypothetical protein